jgi:hypothetical protein
VTPLYFAPDIDNSWSVAPGACTTMNALAPLQNGAYGTIGTSNLFTSSTITGSDILHAQTFRKVDGSVRFLVFRKENIDEYSNSAVRTNRGTGYSASTTAWNAAAWGNQIIACNNIDATQSSTGGAFSSLGGGCPIASKIAANLNFVMLADVNDGAGFDYDDAVWWCALQDPTSWTPSLATQAGRIRLLDAPGPIKALVAYRDMFVAFKDDAMFVGVFTGPFIFEWRMVSAKVGCVGSKAVGEIDGKLVFVHQSGVWEFDGQSLRNVGLPVFHSILQAAGQYRPPWLHPSVNLTPSYGLNFAAAAVDDAEGVIWFRIGQYLDSSTDFGYSVLHGYNARTGKWGKHYVTTTSAGLEQSAMIRTSNSDMQDFMAATTSSVGRIFMVWNDTGGSTVRAVKYPFDTSDSSVASFSLGTFGSAMHGTKLNAIYLRHVPYSEALSAGDVTATVTTYKNENQDTSYATVSATFNAEFNRLDCHEEAKFIAVTAIAYPAGYRGVIAGVDVDMAKAGAR